MSWGLWLSFYLALLIQMMVLWNISHLIRPNIRYNNETKMVECHTHTRTHNEIFGVLTVLNSNKMCFCVCVQTNVIFKHLTFMVALTTCYLLLKCVSAVIFCPNTTILCVLDKRCAHVRTWILGACTQQNVEDDCKWDVIIMVVDERRVIMSQRMLLGHGLAVAVLIALMWLFCGGS